MSSLEAWLEYAITEMGMPLAQLPVVILSAVSVYFVFLLLVKLFGARTLTVTTTSDAVLVTMLGAVAGRGIIGLNPTIAAGIVGLATLFSLEMLFHGFRESRLVKNLAGSDPIVVFANGKPVREACRTTRTSKSDLVSAMRGAGVGEFSEVQMIVLEPTGGYSIIREGETISSELLEGVRGSHHLEG